MNDLITKCASLTDEELTKDLRFMIDRERRNLGSLLVYLGEFDRRKLYRGDGYPSMFVYCTRAMGYDENAAYRRITAARVARLYREIIPLVQEGALTLTSILILGPVLSAENHEELFVAAKGKTRRELETLVAGRAPQPDRPDFLRRLPAPAPAWASPEPNVPPAVLAPSNETPAAHPIEPIPEQPPSEWQAVMPLSLDRVRIGFDAALQVMKLIDRARQVLFHKYPQGRLEDIMREALEVLLERKDPQRRLALKPAEAPVFITEDGPVSPRHIRTLSQGRYISQAVRRVVWNRDGGRCSYRMEDATVCGSREGLEFDHIRPFAHGGRSNTAYNVRLLCRMHNQLAAETRFPSLRPDGPVPPFADGPLGAPA